jgi:4-amino-4-deoxy-L-arabinose transferase-like glycosyltransferase
MNHKVWKYLTSDPAGIVVIFSSLAALVFWLKYSPLFTEDSAYYLLLARAIRQGTFFNQDIGGRTPLFPLFLAMLGGNGQAVFAGQLVLSVLTSLLLFRIFLTLTNSRALAMSVGFVYMLNPSTVLFERTVLTEILTCFLVCLGTWLAVKACNSQVNFARRTLLSSTVFSLAALVRPAFQLLPLAALAAILGLAKERRLRRGHAYKVVAAGLIPFAALVLGWGLVNYYRFGWFTLSTFTGYHLTNHTGEFMRDASPQYPKIAGIYTRYREDRLRRTGMGADAIWEARNELKQTTGMNDVQLSRLLVAISLRLIISHPIGYLETVWRSFKRFWRPPVYARGCNLGDFRNGLREVRAGQAHWFPRFYAYLYFPFVLAYALSLGGPLVLKGWRRLLWAPGMWMVHSVIIYSAVINSLVEYIDNNRYKFPVEGLIIGVALTMFYLILKQARGSADRRQSPAGAGDFAAQSTSLGR